MPCLKVCFSVISVINVKHVIYDAIYMWNMTSTIKHFHVKADDGRCHVSHVNCIINDMFHIDNTYYTEANF
jgi:hypothetical protein